jgi:DNA-binding NtrC family response regulator
LYAYRHHPVGPETSYLIIPDMENSRLLRIFLVDDDPFCLSLYSQFLKNLGQTDVHLFSDSVDCVNGLPLQPDLVILDYQLGQVNGLETLKKIKLVDPNALVVFISGEEDVSVAVNALKYGAIDYLTKTEITEMRLNAVLDTAIRIRDHAKHRHENE